MAETYIWRVIQSWLDGQLVRSNQAALAEAVEVSRQAISQWKSGKSLPGPENLRRLHAVTRIPFSDLTDALLRDMGYTLEDDHGNAAANTRAGGSPAPTAPPHLKVARTSKTKGSAGQARAVQDDEGEAP